MIANPSGAVADLAGHRRGGPRRRRPARRRRHHGHALPVPPDRARRRHRDPLGHQVPRRARHHAGRRGRRVGALRLGQRPLPADDRARAVLRRADVVGQLRRVRLPHQAARRAAARHRRRRCPRTARSCCCRAWRRCRSGWTAHLANARRRRRVAGRRPARVLRVAGPACPTTPTTTRAQRYLPLGPGAVFAFGVAGGRAAGERFIESVQLCSHLANIGDVRTLVHPPGVAPRTSSSRPNSWPPPACRRTSCASRSGSRIPTTSCGTSTRPSPRPRRRRRERARERTSMQAGRTPPRVSGSRSCARPAPWRWSARRRTRRAPATSSPPTCCPASSYEVWFVNPNATEILGRPVYPSLADLPGVPDLVDVFRRTEDLPGRARRRARR